ncbi:MAG: hypothetical protein HXY52_03975 [Nitrospirae bacterium]|nr:hypothetical protein [Nitrospirota bacterium]
MQCKICGGNVKVIISCRMVTCNCMECGKKFSLKEYINEIDEQNLEKIACRPCDRV